jgi:hypothetical protein
LCQRRCPLPVLIPVVRKTPTRRWVVAPFCTGCGEARMKEARMNPEASMGRWPVVRRVLSFWVTPLRPETWRRFGYAIVALPATVVCLAMTVAGRADTAARYQRRLAAGLSGRPVGAPPHRVRVVSVLACSLAGLAIGVVTCVLLQDLAFLVFINVAYPLRAYLSLAGNPENFLPWQGWNLLWSIRIHEATGPDPWGDTYNTSWGGPTLAGAWVVHAGLALLTIFPVLAWAIRGLTRLQAAVTRALLVTEFEPAGGPTRQNARQTHAMHR